MLPTVDINGPEFRAWFGNSCAVDAAGAPLLVFRGEHGRGNGGAFQSRLGAISFADLQSAMTYAVQPNDRTEIAGEPRILPAYLRIQRPFMLEPEDPYLELSAIAGAFGHEEAKRIALKFEAWVRRTDNWGRIQDELGESITVAGLLDRDPDRLAELYFLAYPFLDDAEETPRLRAAGFDGAVHAGSAVTAGKPEYKIFDQDCVMPATERWLSPDEATELLGVTLAIMGP
jgi:hypothetical protein